MEEFKDINGKVLESGNKVVVEADTYLLMGIYSHPAKTTVVIKSVITGNSIRFIRKSQTQNKIYKI